MRRRFRSYLGTSLVVCGLLIVLSSPTEIAFSVANNVKSCAEDGDITGAELDGTPPTDCAVTPTPTSVGGYEYFLGTGGGGNDCDVDESATNCANCLGNDDACGRDHQNFDQDYDYFVNSGATKMGPWVNQPTGYAYGGSTWYLTKVYAFRAPAAGFGYITVTVKRKGETHDGDGDPADGTAIVTESETCLL